MLPRLQSLQPVLHRQLSMLLQLSFTPAPTLPPQLSLLCQEQPITDLVSIPRLPMSGLSFHQLLQLALILLIEEKSTPLLLPSLTALPTQQITTSIPFAASSLTYGVGPGYFLIGSVTAGLNWNTATATASEVYLTYIASNGTATTKAITSNTNTNVFFSVKNVFFLNGTAYVVYAMSTHTVASGTTADTWTLNGVYIHGVTLSTGALLNYTTGGVKMLSLTQSVTGATTCIALTNTGCATSAPSSQVSSFSVGVQNFTQNADTVWYLWSDQSTANAYTIKLGSINVTTGAATSGTTLTTTAADTGAGTTASPTISTSYSIAGFPWLRFRKFRRLYQQTGDFYC